MLKIIHLQTFQLDNNKDNHVKFYHVLFNNQVLRSS